MKALYLMPLAALLAAACTYTPTGDDVHAELHPPIVYQDWNTNHYTIKNGLEVCSVSSGYNGLTVFMSHGTSGLDVMVGSNRRMEPGATFTVSANGATSETYEAFFKPDQSKQLVDAMGKGGKAYLEWAENGGPAGRSLIHIQNIARLDGFSAKLDECRRQLGAK